MNKEESKKYMDNVMVDKAIGMVNSRKEEKKRDERAFRRKCVCKCQEEDHLKNFKTLVGGVNQFLLMILLLLLIRTFS